MAEATQIGLVIEQALGHITHAENIRHWLDNDRLVSPHWMMIPYHAEDRWDKIPGLPFSMRISLRARSVVQQNLQIEPLDCLYFHTHNLALFSLGLMKRIPTVISLDATPVNFMSIAAAYEAKVSSGIVNQVKAAWFRRAFSLAMGIVTMSEWAKASMVRDYGILPEKVKVFPFGVNVQQWQPSAAKPSPERRLRLLFVGGDFERKGGHVLINAFQQGLSSFCELDIVTSKQTVLSGNHVRIHTGIMPNSMFLKKLFAEADAFIMPTMGDATPIAILEAMASGLPVITTKVGAMGEMVVDGVSGYFVSQSDPKGIIDAVTRLAGNRAMLKVMGQAGRVSVERRFNAEINAKSLIEYLKEVSALSPTRSGRK